MSAPFLGLALKQAARSRCRYRVGAVLARGSRVLGGSANLQRNPPHVDFRHATFHAEEAVLRRVVCPRGATAYVARLGRDGSPLMARPCWRCQRALTARGVVRVHYTTPQGAGVMLLADPGC
ncbi:hypothetical protein [Streptomyces chartreusis]|uniref:hypothetical protein n=1 Tax=Streptomyces chartreusis TaxID=1969 RepID=UPI00399BD7B0